MSEYLQVSINYALAVGHKLNFRSNNLVIRFIHLNDWQILNLLCKFVYKSVAILLKGIMG